MEGLAHNSDSVNESERSVMIWIETTSQRQIQRWIPVF